MFGFFQNLGPMELVIILVIVLVIFGAGKLPSVGKAIGQSINEFRRARSDSEIADGKGNEEKKS
ncbi:MAG: twin-arginine translocase TatA/TatE family subunit [Acidobacteriota bacterium]